MGDQEPSDLAAKKTTVHPNAGRLPEALACSKLVRARAMFLGQHIDLRQFTAGQRLAVRPLVISIGSGNATVLFRYGVAVIFDASHSSQPVVVRDIAPFVKERHAVPETEEVILRVGGECDEGIEDETICVQELTIERLQIIASVLSKSVVLAEYESRVSENFDRVEPFAVELGRHGRGGRQMKKLLRQIGNVLLTEHKMVGRVEVREKPEVLWEHPELETLYAHLEVEFEIGERYAALERKLALTSRTVGTVLDLLQNRRTLRVEWYIVILIVVEIVIMVYEIFWHSSS
jgi:uncharacterized Rmd1/YagE family protein